MSMTTPLRLVKIGGMKTHIPSTFQVPITEETRFKGNRTMTFSLIAIAMIRLNFVPTKIEGLGLAFDKTEQAGLLLILLLAVLYFWFGFILYGAQDWVAHRAELYAEKMKEHAEQADEPATGLRIPPSGVVYYRDKLEKNPLYRPLFSLHILYDLVLPIAGGIWAAIEIVSVLGK